MAEETVETVETREDIEARLRVELTAQYDADYNSRLETEIKKISDRMMADNKQIVDDALERMRKEMTPPTTQDIQKMVEQEYLEFKVQVKTRKITKEFTICELPQRAERRILKKIKDIVIPFSQDLAALSLNMLEGDAAKKIVQLMNTAEPVLASMASIAVVCLNPSGEDADVNEDWVIDNLSSTRIVKIVTAQMEANHMRDFLSLLFQGSKLLKQAA